MTLRDEWGYRRDSLNEEERIEELTLWTQGFLGTDREDELDDLLLKGEWPEIVIALHNIGYIDDEDVTG